MARTAHTCEEAQSLAPMGMEHTFILVGTLRPLRPSHQGHWKDDQGTWRGRPRPDSLLPSFPDYGDPLTVFRPSNVLDLPSERLVLVLEEVLLLCGVPDPQLPGHICGQKGGGSLVTTGHLLQLAKAAWEGCGVGQRSPATR